MRDRKAAEVLGREAEERAARYLSLKGWRIEAQRVRTEAGEIDLIARRRGIVAFVEVKARATQRELDEAIDLPRLKRVAAAAEALIPEHCGAGEDARIDVILIAPARWPVHLENVWHGF